MNEVKLLYPEEYSKEKDDLFKRNNCLKCKFCYYDDWDGLFYCEKHKILCPQITDENHKENDYTGIYNCCDDFELD